MTILLTAINAKYIHSNPAVFDLRAYAAEYREQIRIAEFTINNQKDFILEEIYKEKPDVLCFSVYIWNLDYVETVASEFHKLCPDVPIWVGGPEVSYEVERFLQEHPYVAGVMIGEGEQTFLELCRFWNRGTKQTAAPEEVRGIAYRREGRVVFTPERLPLDMSTIPFSYDDLENFSNRIIYYESSRGCPFSCSYCLSSVEKSLRFRDLGLVKKELQFFIDRNVPQVKFVDRTFNCNHHHAMEIWQYITEHDNGITNFHFEISADLLKEEELELISRMRPGLIQLEIGVQSTNEGTIREIHRTMNLEALKKIVRRVQKAGNVHQHLDLIAGLPEEGFESFRNSFDEIYALKSDQLQLGFLKVLKGSYMYEHAADYGILYHDEPPYEVLQTNWLSFDELLKIRKVEEMLEVYYNSCQFEMTMKVIEPLYPGAFDFFLKLGSFYETHGYMNMSHSRIRRCEILLEFLREDLKAGSGLKAETEPDPGPADHAGGNAVSAEKIISLLQEALTFDLYYRENCKSRPSWAPDPGNFRKMTHDYCKSGKLSHIEPFHYEFPGKGIRTITVLPEYHAEPVWVLFDYEHRDPLDHQAAVSQVPVTGQSL